eukprot:3933660-Pleurochrysis_carterae.AAC.3
MVRQPPLPAAAAAAASASACVLSSRAPTPDILRSRLPMSPAAPPPTPAPPTLPPFAGCTSLPSKMAPYLASNSANGIRDGKPCLRMRTISRMPEYCSCERTRGCSKPKAAMPSFGLTQRM